MPGQTVDGSCPFCMMVIEDPVLLVQHVEEKHGEGRGVGGGEGGGGGGCRVG